MKDEIKNFLFEEKYRPKTVAECILPDRLKKVFQSYVDTKEIPNLLLFGPPGSGKTTVAIAMCEEIGLNYLFIPSSDERGIDTLRTKVKTYASTISLMGGKKVIIFDEADGITADAQNALRGVTQEFSDNCTFIFTCNTKAKLIDALHSRTASIDFFLKSDEKDKMTAAFYKRLVVILNTENIPFEEKALAKIVKQFFPDYRRTLVELQRYSSGGSIDAGTVAQLSDVRKFSELRGFLKDKDFTAMRNWVATNSDIDASRLYRKVYDSLYENLKSASIPQAVVTIAKYLHMSAFSADQEITVTACLTELMIDCEFQE